MERQQYLSAERSRTSKGGEIEEKGRATQRKREREEAKNASAHGSVSLHLSSFEISRSLQPFRCYNALCGDVVSDSTRVSLSVSLRSHSVKREEGREREREKKPA
jgi:hypothetical protein